MTEDFQDVYNGSIDPRLFPYYLHLESSAELLAGASESCKQFYTGEVENALTALKAAKMMIDKPGE
jgi:hypothetical protein